MKWLADTKAVWQSLPKSWISCVQYPFPPPMGLLGIIHQWKSCPEIPCCSPFALVFFFFFFSSRAGGVQGVL